MGQIKVTYDLDGISGLCTIESMIHGDSRGYFMETFSQKDMYEAGLYFSFVQDNQSMSTKSPTYGKYHGEILTADNKKQYLIPRGFAHGFLVLSDEAEFCYKCDDFYHPNDEGGLAWNDPEIGIVWPKVIGSYPQSADSSGYKLSDGSPLVLSEKDQKWKGINETFKF